MQVRTVDPTKEDLRYLDGPWSNTTCRGYAIMAMRRASIDEATIQKVMHEMTRCFDDTTVEEAAQYYYKGVAI